MSIIAGLLFFIIVGVITIIIAIIKNEGDKKKISKIYDNVGNLLFGGFILFVIVLTFIFYFEN